MIRAAVLACTLAACVSTTDDIAPWEPADAITGRLAPELGPPPPISAAPSTTLRIATFNVHFGKQPEDLADAIAHSAQLATADVILLQEIEAYPEEPGTRTRRMAEALGMTWVYAPAREEFDGTHGIAILARQPLANVQIRQLPFVEQPIRERKRIAVEADVMLGDTAVRIVNVHLDVRIGPVDRIRQLDPAAVDQPDPVVLGGDFNTNPWAWVDATVPLLASEAILGQEQALVVDDYMFDNGFTGAIGIDTSTLRLPAFQMRTDDLYARGLHVVASGIDTVDGSDHWPVWIDVSN